MLGTLAVWLVVADALVLGGLAWFWHWGTRWGSTPQERARKLPGDEYFGESLVPRVAMTRAVSIGARPETVWPWLAQLGRGAGWYSLDRVDNGSKVSARHIVSWIPEPRLGDATPIGYLRHIEPGRALVWWVKGVPFLGARTRLAFDVRLDPEQAGARLVIRISADAEGRTARLALLAFPFIDSIMARRQLLGIAERVERYGARADAPEEPETGARDQYQLYEVIYASGESAGVRGKEDAANARRSAIEDGVLPAEKGDRSIFESPRRGGGEKTEE